MTAKTTWWNSSARNVVYARWGVIVLINATFPFILATSFLQSTPQLIGIMLVVVSFIIAYAEFDLWLIDNRHAALSKQLRISAIIKIGTVLLPFIDMIIGLISMASIKVLTGFDLETLTHNSRHQENIQQIEPTALITMSLSYLTTMINGVLLTLLVGMILLLVRATQSRLAKRRAYKSSL